MPNQRLTEFLNEEHVAYATRTHALAYTAHEIAHAAHVPGREFAKTVMVSLDGRPAMAVIPADERVDLDLLATVAGCREVHLLEEPEFAELFPDCELGAMPPFGNLWNLPVFVSERLAKDEVIAFNAGNHRELIELAYADFSRLVTPKVAGIAARLN